jgi:hypothetical protein
MKKTLKTLPEFYYMGLGIFSIMENYFASTQINYIALLITWLMFLQVFYKHKILGLIYGNVCALFSVYMLLTVVSGYQDFQAGGLEEVRSLIFSSVLFSTGLVMAILMIYNYATTESKFNENELTITY